MENGNPAVAPAEEQVTAPPEESPDTDVVLEQEALDSVVVEDPAVRLEAVTSERDRLVSENEELRDRLLRRQADFENFRRRVEKDRTVFLEYAGMESVRALLPVLDDFERALSAAPVEGGPGAEYVKGVEMIGQAFFEALKKLGLEPIASAGQPFDPNVHHAVETVQTGDAEDQTVIEEFQKGYNFRGRLLREAMVKVAVKPSQPAEDD